jgi:acetyl-CoA acetyltransferase
MTHLYHHIHQRAYDAQRDGRFKDEIIPIQVNSVEYTNAGPKVKHLDLRVIRQIGMLHFQQLNP